MPVAAAAEHTGAARSEQADLAAAETQGLATAVPVNQV
jgi:hypothetical protein